MAIETQTRHTLVDEGSQTQIHLELNRKYEYFGLSVVGPDPDSDPATFTSISVTGPLGEFMDLLEAEGVNHQADAVPIAYRNGYNCALQDLLDKFDDRRDDQRVTMGNLRATIDDLCWRVEQE